MIVDPKKYIAHDRIKELGLIFKNCVRLDDADSLKQYCYSISENEHGTDYDGIEVYQNPNIKMLGIDLFENSEGYIQTKFKSAIEYAQTMPGVIKLSLNIIGPRSIIPFHIDDQSLPMNYDTVDYNVVTGLYVPSNNLSDLGIQIDKLQVTHDEFKSIVFSRQVPHKGWNRTDQYWIMYILFIEKSKFA